MIRVRFFANLEDPRPVSWPIRHPYWITGETEYHSIIVAYAENEDEILRLWPDAVDLDVFEHDAKSYHFSDRFPRPDWLVEGKTP